MLFHAFAAANLARWNAWSVCVNGGVLAAGVGVFIFDKTVTAKLREQTEKDLANPYLKKGLLDNAGDDDGE